MLSPLISSVNDLQIWLDTMIYHPCHESLQLEMDLIKSQPSLHDYVSRIDEIRESLEIPDSITDEYLEQIIENAPECKHNQAIKERIEEAIDHCNQILQNHEHR